MIVGNLPVVRTVPVVLLTLVLAACQPAAASPQADVTGAQLVVELRDYSLKTNVASLPAGKVKIGIRNLGAMVHDFVVLKTDTAFDKLPIDGAAAKAKDDGKIGGIEAIGVGQVKALTLDLTPGSYVLLCNVAGHYQLGMRAALKVD